MRATGGTPADHTLLKTYMTKAHQSKPIKK